MKDHAKQTARLTAARALEVRAKRTKSKRAKRAYLTLARAQRRRAGQY